MIIPIGITLIAVLAVACEEIISERRLKQNREEEYKDLISRLEKIVTGQDTP